MDPRTNVIDKRLRKVKRIIVVSGGKGGIGKSMVASNLALILSNMGKNVGLFDLDFTSPSAHVILGIKDVFPEEEKGIIPPEANGIKFMSMAYYSGGPVPLRGEDVTNALIELLAITRWGDLDFLIVDMPPGIGDAIMDTIRLMKKAEFLVLTTPSRLTKETTKKVLAVLEGVGNPVIGIVENMGKDIRFDENIEQAIGDPEKMMQTDFSKDLEKIAGKLIR